MSHVAIDHGAAGWSVYRIDANGGFSTDEHIPNRHAAERIARQRDVQLAARELDRAVAALDAA